MTREQVPIKFVLFTQIRRRETVPKILSGKQIVFFSDQLHKLQSMGII